jgi:protein DJ-1
MKTALVLCAEGSEEMETVIAVDILRRADFKVTLVSCHGERVTCSRGIQLHADALLGDILDQVLDFDVVLLPGGLGGAKTFASDIRVQQILKDYERLNKWTAVMCAAPIAIKAASAFQGRALTSHPSLKSQLESFFDYKEDRVVIDGNLITSRGPGTAIEWALEVVRQIQGQNVYTTVRDPLMA